MKFTKITLVAVAIGLVGPATAIADSTRECATGHYESDGEIEYGVLRAGSYTACKVAATIQLKWWHRFKDQRQRIVGFRMGRRMIQCVEIAGRETRMNISCYELRDRFKRKRTYIASRSASCCPAIRRMCRAQRARHRRAS